ncbi:MAG: sulfotransferase family protein [Vicinamibacteria bacterium]|nr:sulfotransferase family protein [Vicinamibacteria bacterium]
MRSGTAGALERFLRRLRYGRPIVVVSGLPRSGTSMMMQMLQAGGLEIVTDAVRTPDGSNPKGYFEFEAVKDLDKGAPPAWLAGARGKAVKIVSSLVRWLPETYDYQVIFMERNLDEVIASQNRMLAERGSLQDEAQNARFRHLYQTHIEDTLRLLRGRGSVSMLVVDYSETLARPADTARRVDRFLRGRLDVDRMAAAADPALHRNRSRTE